MPSQIASMIDASPSEFISLAVALRPIILCFGQCCIMKKHVITSAIEHPAVLKVLRGTAILWNHL
ncbi:MAG: hypothetical protein CM15mP58_19090 [Burkholderiaceae bacterium]|nr:MAG: hypothetical protein CM15mP58_19090 [Burkholderiaceae bacterium]